MFSNSIPICCAIVVFIFLHRRSRKRQALEDVNDPHKSLDFGLDLGGGPRKPGKARRGLGGKRAAPEMLATDFDQDPMRPGKKTRGLSMDMLGSPYLLPAGLQGSRESLHSMSRSVQNDYDPYRSIALVRPSEERTRSPRPFNENGSLYSAPSFNTSTNERSNLVQHSYPISQSYPKRGDSMLEQDTKPSEDTSTQQMHSSNRNETPGRKSSLLTSTPSLPNISETGLPQKKSLPPLPSPPELHSTKTSFPPPPEPQAQEAAPPPRTSSMRRPPRQDSVGLGVQSVDRHMSESSYYGDETLPPPPPPKIMEPGESDYFGSDVMYPGRFSIDNSAPSQQIPVQSNRLSTMGLRPLPPDDPAENAEQRANRIRSFYKEYFDDRRPNPVQGYYEEDWDAGYYGMEGAVFDPETGDYFMAPQAPYAQPMGRRAMTPPPRGGPRFGEPDHGRHYSTMSAGRGPLRGRPAQRAPPQKKLPPPKALSSLPTPHRLQDDTAILSPLDFAPPTSFREVQNGRRADSPLGIQRPYSPSVRAYSPLVSSFEGMNALPSPHSLRKSGTFTSLDFAPPAPRFKGQDGTSSDAGSIRSTRSGNISAMQMDAVRAGAYRASRIPKEFVTSREDLSAQLRPKMDMTTPG